LTGVVLAGLVLVIQNFESITSLIFGVGEFAFVEQALGAWLSLAAFGVIAWVLIRIPLAKMRA
jgi:hypothetical protein